MKDTSTWTRRRALKAIGTSIAAIPLLELWACSDENGQQAADLGQGTDMAQADQGTTADQGQDMSAQGWATGGTAAMLALASYPDPFASNSGSTCALTCGATIGPCHTTSPERQDVSDGLDGIPLRLAIRVVDEDCNPVKDAIVEIWHTNYKGIYSGQINTMCNKDEADRAAQYFRGYQRTDEDGKVFFSTCYPGWYTSRVVHIHFRIQTGDYQAADNAAAEVISQLFFSDELNNQIFSDQTLYKEFGLPDTQLGNDNVVGGESDLTNYLLDVSRMSDGAMLASKTVILRSSSASACTLKGAGGAGPGNPPG